MKRAVTIRAPAVTTQLAVAAVEVEGWSRESRARLGERAPVDVEPKILALEIHWSPVARGFDTVDLCVGHVCYRARRTVLDIDRSNDLSRIDAHFGTVADHKRPRAVGEVVGSLEQSFDIGADVERVKLGVAAEEPDWYCLVELRDDLGDSCFTAAVPAVTFQNRMRSRGSVRMINLWSFRPDKGPDAIPARK